MALYFMIISGMEPWTDNKYVRPESCAESINANFTSTELFVYEEVTKYISRDTCIPFDVEEDAITFNLNLFYCVIVCWMSCYVAVINGVKSSSYFVMITSTVPFILVIYLAVIAMGFNNDASGKALNYMF